MADAMRYFMAKDRAEASAALFTDAEQRLLSSCASNSAAAATPKATASCDVTPDSTKGKYARSDGKGVRLRWNDGENLHVKKILIAVKSGAILGTMLCVLRARKSASGASHGSRSNGLPRRASVNELSATTK